MSGWYVPRSIYGPPTAPNSGAVGAGAICVLPDEPSLQFDTARPNGFHEEIKMKVVSVVK